MINHAMSEAHCIITFNHLSSSLFGAPLGGFSRATRSRLAALPVRLVGNSIFWENEDATAKPSEMKSKELGQGPYFTMRDGMGRQFACRIYDEDDLTPESMSQSMFDAAIENVNGSDHTDADTGEDSKMESSLDEHSSKKSGEHEGEDSESAEPEVDKVEVFFTLDLEDTLENGMKNTNNIPLLILDTKSILESLKNLDGLCTQLHAGWWSYEWCHDDKVTQFHVQVQANQLDDVLSVQDLMPQFVVQSVSTIGNFSKRIIIVEAIEEMSDTYVDYDGANKEESEITVGDIVVVDTFDGGEYCEEAAANRKVDVRFKCCSNEDVMNSIKKEGGNDANNVHLFLDNVEKPRAILLSVQEKSVCNYVAEVCTNVLCDNWLDDTETAFSAEEFGLSIKPIEFQRDDSIRYILDETLGDDCLKKSEGWWTYSFCHQSTAYQFHESVDLDLDKGVMKATVEAKHILGKYDTGTSEDFPKEDEIKHIVFPEGQLKDDAGSEVEARSSSTQGLGVGSAYYAQEYTHGDVCEGEDIIDSAIKGGAVVQGGIERSTTVRFFCGSKKELVRINEDHSCHYIIDVTVPELCVHKYFEIPHIKKHAVKCLPVDSYSAHQIRQTF